MKLELLKTDWFNETEMEIYNDDVLDMYFTREQIGQALEYENPRKSMQKLHDRHKEELAPYTSTMFLETADGKTREIIVYNFDGLFEICRYSTQPNATKLIHWARDIMKAYIRGDIVDVKTFKQGIEAVKKGNYSLMYKTALICETDEAFGWKDPHVALAEASAIRKFEFQDGTVERKLGFAPTESVELLCQKYKSLDNSKNCTYIHHRRYWNNLGMTRIKDALQKDRDKRELRRLKFEFNAADYDPNAKY